MMKLLDTLLVPINTKVVTEAKKSAKRKAHDAKKKAREANRIQERFQAYNKIATRHLSPEDIQKAREKEKQTTKRSFKGSSKSTNKKKKYERIVRDRKSLPIKIIIHNDGKVVPHHVDPNKDNIHSVTHAPGKRGKDKFPGATTISLKSDKDVLEYFIRTNKERKQHHPLGPSKGGGGGVVGPIKIKGFNKHEMTAVKKHLRSLIEKHKMDPSPDIVNFFANKAVKTLKSVGGDQALKKIRHILTPPITKRKDVKRTLIYQVAKQLAIKLHAKYDPEALGYKNFEAKKLGYNNRVSEYKKHFKNIDDTLLNFGSHDVLFLDDILTTGTSVKAVHEYFTSFEHKTKKGSKTSGTVITKSKRKPMRGKMHSIVLLKNL